VTVGRRLRRAGRVDPRAGAGQHEQVPLEITRLHLASLQGLDGRRWPVHGFVVTHPGGAVLVDTGVGGPQQWLDDWRVVNRSVADALADLDMSPADIGLVINTHLHFDHCGQNAVFKHAPCYVQRAELSRAERESPELYDWFGFMNARFELLDGDAEVLPGLEVIATPGHTAGHQCVVVRGQHDAFDLLIGDAAYTPRIYADPGADRLPAGQASDVAVWRDSVRRIRSLGPERVHFCHHTDVVHR
jgi:N-acyl homoserine lactone hydrolase